MTAFYEAITPDTVPTTTQCRALFIPDDPLWIGAVTGVLSLLALPSAWEDAGGMSAQDAAAAWAAYFDKFCFKQGECRLIGEVVAWAGSTAPDANWLLCDGSSLLRADYPDLFTVIGVVYGATDGTHFNLPDLQGRVAIGVGSGAGLSTVNLGDANGEESHTLTTTEIPSHTHVDTGHTHSEGIAVPALGAALVGVPIPSAIPGVGVTGLGAAAIGSAGGSGAHNNLQPYLGLNYLIRALP